jgi:hypothetical protein
MRKLHALLLAVLVTVILGTTYTLVQQYGRSSANDQPTMLAESIAAEMKDASAQTTLPLGKLNVATSLQPFIVIYNKSYKPVAGTGYLNGKLPSVDKGVLQHATAGHSNAVTWQPQKDVRIAAVVVKQGDYYVLGGQSLRLTEARDSHILRLAALGWVAAMVCLGAGYWMLNKR